MTKKRPDSVDEFMRKQKEKKAQLPAKAVEVLPAIDLKAAAAKIKQLMKTMVTNGLELGNELKTAREAFPEQPNPKPGMQKTRPGWEKWLKENFGMSTHRASSLIRFFERYNDRALREPGLAQANLPAPVLEELFTSNIDNAKDVELMDTLITENKKSIRETGKPLSKRKAERIITKRREERGGTVKGKKPKPDQQLPTKAEARRIAQDERAKGHTVLVAARDGNLYSGATDEEAKTYEDMRHTVFSVERAVDTLLKIEQTPHEYMQSAPMHLRWWRTKEKTISEKGEQVAQVARWLTAFAAAIEALRREYTDAA